MHKGVTNSLHLVLVIIVVLFNIGCKDNSKPYKLITNVLKDSKGENPRNLFGNKVMVVAHRGDWRNAPENSLSAIQNCIDMGVDMVEIDLKRTNDSAIIVMHDKRLDRTTSGSGLVEDMTLESIKKLHLKNGYGMETSHKIPLLKDALNLCKDKILVFLDKGYAYVPAVMEIVHELDMQEQVFFEGRHTYSKIKLKYDRLLKDYNYMPRVNVSNDSLVYEEYIKPFLAGESQIFICSVDKKSIEGAKTNINVFHNAGKKVMLTTLWDNTCAGYTDDKAVTAADENWGEVVELGADLICTDRPRLLLEFLRKKGLHN